MPVDFIVVFRMGFNNLVGERDTTSPVITEWSPVVNDTSGVQSRVHRRVRLFSFHQFLKTSGRRRKAIYCLDLFNQSKLFEFEPFRCAEIDCHTSGPLRSYHSWDCLGGVNDQFSGATAKPVSSLPLGKVIVMRWTVPASDLSHGFREPRSLAGTFALWCFGGVVRFKAECKPDL